MIEADNLWTMNMPNLRFICSSANNLEGLSFRFICVLEATRASKLSVISTLNWITCKHNLYSFKVRKIM
jgi:hypothetical protein